MVRNRSLVERAMVLNFTILNRRVPHFILVHVVYPTQEDRHSTTTPSPSSNLAPLHCNGRKSLSVVGICF